MVFKKGDENVGGDINLGTDSWNVAKGYTQLKILQPLYYLDRYDTIAQFGTMDLGDDQEFDDNTIKKRRVESLQRFHSTLKQLLGNVLFAVKRADQKGVIAFQERLLVVDEFMIKVFESREDKVSHELLFSIDEKLFAQILEILQDIKDKINTLLNNAGLIFRASEEIDLDKIMDQIVEGG